MAGGRGDELAGQRRVDGAEPGYRPGPLGQPERGGQRHGQVHPGREPLRHRPRPLRRRGQAGPPRPRVRWSAPAAPGTAIRPVARPVPIPPDPPRYLRRPGRLCRPGPGRRRRPGGRARRAFPGRPGRAARPCRRAPRRRGVAGRGCSGSRLAASTAAGGSSRPAIIAFPEPSGRTSTRRVFAASSRRLAAAAALTVMTARAIRSRIMPQVISPTPGSCRTGSPRRPWPRPGSADCTPPR